MNILKITSADFAEEWFLRLFVSSFPYQTTLRIFDSFLNEGSKILYRAGLAILMIKMNELLKTTTPKEFISILQHCTIQFFDDDLSMKKAFGISMSRRHFDNLNTKNKPKLSAVIEPKLPMYYRPKIHTPSKIITIQDFELLWSWLPQKIAIEDPILLFSTADDGFSLTTFFNKIGSTKPTIMILKTDQNEVFGAFVTEAWARQTGYFGDRDCFLWSLKPNAKKFGWYKGCTDYFMEVTSKKLLVGGGDGSGLELDDEFNNGVTQKCTSFQNDPLTKDGRHNFRCVAVEMYGFG